MFRCLVLVTGPLYSSCCWDGHMMSLLLRFLCSPLQVLRFIDVPWLAKPEPELPAAASGFPELKELWLSKYVCSITDDICQKLLKGSRKLRVLVLHGCCKISPQALSELPCTGQYLSNSRTHNPPPPYSWCGGPGKNCRGGRGDFWG